MKNLFAFTKVGVGGGGTDDSTRHKLQGLGSILHGRGEGE